MGWLIEKWIRHTKTSSGGATDYSSLGRHLPPSCGAGARDSGAEKKMGAINTSVLSIFVYTLRKPDRNTGMGNRGKGSRSTHKSGLNFHGEGGLKDCACWSGEA